MKLKTLLKAKGRYFVLGTAALVLVALFVLRGHQADADTTAPTAVQSVDEALTIALAAPLPPAEPAPQAPPGAPDPTATTAFQPQADQPASQETPQTDALRQQLGALELKVAALDARLQAQQEILDARPAAHDHTAAPVTTASAPIKRRRRKTVRPAPAVQFQAHEQALTPEVLPPPFTVEAVDTWDGEKRVVIRDGGRFVDLKEGDHYQGWTVRSTLGQSVTLRNAAGDTHILSSDWRNHP